jgi:hypothetical protein
MQIEYRRNEKMYSFEDLLENRLLEKDLLNVNFVVDGDKSIGKILDTCSWGILRFIDTTGKITVIRRYPNSPGKLMLFGYTEDTSIEIPDIFEALQK